MSTTDRALHALLGLGLLGALLAPTTWRALDPGPAVRASVVSSSDDWARTRDPWGRMLVRLPLPAGAARGADRVGWVSVADVYSLGSDGLDQQGGGDDVLVAPASTPVAARFHRTWVQPILYLWIRPIALLLLLPVTFCGLVLRLPPLSTRLREVLLGLPVTAVLTCATIAAHLVLCVCMDDGLLPRASPSPDWLLVHPKWVYLGSVAFACATLVAVARAWRALEAALSPDRGSPSAAP